MASVTIRTFLAGQRLSRVVGGSAALVAMLLILLAAFPWGVLKSTIEARLSTRFGRTVTIGSVARLDAFSFSPTVAIRDVRVPQPGWAGKGDLARIAQAEVKFGVFPLLVGRFSPESIKLSGLHLALVRTADKHENWNDGEDGSGSSGSPPRITGLTIADSTISYQDAKAERSFTVAVTADSARGLRANGTGMVRGSPVKVSFSGAAVEDMAGRPWPVHAIVDGPAIGMEVRGTADAPLDLHAMTLDVTAHASDLKMLDGIIEAGLFGTQPVRLKAHVRRDAPDWKITALSGTIGQSDLTGKLDVEKNDGRTKLTGDVVFGTLNFDDLSTDSGLAKGRALERAIGPRLIPDTRINIAKIDKTDGIITVLAKRIVSSEGSSAITALNGTVKLDHQLLVFSPLRIALRTGAMVGTVRVDQRGGKPEPLVTIDLSLRDSNIVALTGGSGAIDGRVDGRATLIGTGSTIREIVGRSNGRIGVFARNGSLPARIAALIGFDAGRALTTKDDKRAGLRCIALRLDMRNGSGAIDPLVIDTSESQSHGEGSVSFPTERLAIRLTGAPKKDSVLRLPGSVIVSGTIIQPDIVVPPEVKSVGNIFRAIGRAISGNQAPTAGNADCAALSTRALGR